VIFNVAEMSDISCYCHFLVIFWFLVDSYCIVEVGISFTLKACYNYIGSLKTPIFIGFILYYYNLFPNILGETEKYVYCHGVVRARLLTVVHVGQVGGHGGQAERARGARIKERRQGHVRGYE